MTDIGSSKDINVPVDEPVRQNGPFKDAAERRAASAWPAAKRQQRIKTILVRYPVFNRAVDAVKHYHMPVKDGVPDTGKIGGLLGESRSGKSTAIKHYTDALGNVATPDFKVPRAVYVDAKKGMNSNGLANLLYAKMGLHRRSQGAAGQHLKIVTDDIVDAGVELVIIDDAQWLLLSKFSRTVEDTLGFLIDTAERKTCNVLLAGIPELRHVIESNEHASGRGGFPTDAVEPFDWYTMEGREDFRKLLSIIGTYLPFRDLPAFADPLIAAHFYKLSGGMIGRVMNYIEAAAFKAINDKADTVEVEHLIFAASKRRRVNDVFRPFESEIDIDDPGETLAHRDEQDSDEAEAEVDPHKVLRKRGRPKKRLKTSSGLNRSATG